ncbi:hypothetical protein VPH35_011744 [Triticum aestivum]
MVAASKPPALGRWCRASATGIRQGRWEAAPPLPEPHVHGNNSEVSSGKGASAEVVVGVRHLAEVRGLAAAAAMQRSWRPGGGARRWGWRGRGSGGRRQRKESGQTA